jgi:hypothetical protein
METDLPFRIIFCFDHDWKTPPDGGLVYGCDCIASRNTRLCDACHGAPASMRENPAGRPTPVARRDISRARSSNNNRQRSLHRA